MNKFIPLIFASVFSQSTLAVIIEGRFDGSMWDFGFNNMEKSPDAKFWSEENAYMPFTGTFWYDTDLATQTSTGAADGLESAEYAGPRNWIHTTLTGYNGASIELTSNSASTALDPPPTEAIRVVNGDHQDVFSAYYVEKAEQSERHGTFFLDSYYSGLDFLNDTNLVQNYSNTEGYMIGHVYFDNYGIRDGEHYGAMIDGEIGSFEIRVREPAAVPEPSSMSLLLGPLLVLLWRGGLFRACARARNPLLYLLDRTARR